MGHSDEWKVLIVSILGQTERTYQPIQLRFVRFRDDGLSERCNLGQRAVASGQLIRQRYSGFSKRALRHDQSRSTIIEGFEG